MFTLMLMLTYMFIFMLTLMLTLMFIFTLMLILYSISGVNKSQYDYKKLRMEDFSAAIESGQLTAEEDNQLDADDDHHGNRA